MTSRAGYVVGWGALVLASCGNTPTVSLDLLPYALPSAAGTGGSSGAPAAGGGGKSGSGGKSGAPSGGNGASAGSAPSGGAGETETDVPCQVDADCSGEEPACNPTVGVCRACSATHPCANGGICTLEGDCEDA